MSLGHRTPSRDFHESFIFHTDSGHTYHFSALCDWWNSDRPYVLRRVFSSDPPGVHGKTHGVARQDEYITVAVNGTSIVSGGVKSGYLVPVLVQDLGPVIDLNAADAPIGTWEMPGRVELGCLEGPQVSMGFVKKVIITLFTGSIVFR